MTETTKNPKSNVLPSSYEMMRNAEPQAMASVKASMNPPNNRLWSMCRYMAEIIEP